MDAQSVTWPFLCVGSDIFSDCASLRPLEKCLGEASISKKHCNFFVNKGNAKFKDMKKLIEFVSESVFKKTGVKLETEIKILE